MFAVTVSPNISPHSMYLDLETDRIRYRATRTYSAVQYRKDEFFYVGVDEVGPQYVLGFGGIADFGRGVEF